MRDAAIVEQPRALQRRDLTFRQRGIDQMSGLRGVAAVQRRLRAGQVRIGRRRGLCAAAQHYQNDKPETGRFSHAIRQKAFGNWTITARPCDETALF